MKKQFTYLYEIKQSQRRLESLTRELEKLAMDGAPSTPTFQTSYRDADAIKGSRKRHDVNDLACRIMALKAEIKEEQAYKEEVEVYLQNIEDFAIKTSNRRKAVYYLRDYAGYPLTVIADKLCLSYQRVKEISAEVKTLEDAEHRKLMSPEEYMEKFGIEIPKGSD